MLLCVYPAELLPDRVWQPCPSGRTALVVTRSCLVAGQSGELRFVTCSLLEASLKPCAFQVSSGLVLSSQGGRVCFRNLTLVGRTVGKHLEPFHNLRCTKLGCWHCLRLEVNAPRMKPCLGWGDFGLISDCLNVTKVSGPESSWYCALSMLTPCFSNCLIENVFCVLVPTLLACSEYLCTVPMF